MHTRRGLVLLFALVAAGSLFLFGPRIPRDQSVEIILGDGAPGITEIELRYAPLSAGHDVPILGGYPSPTARDWTREVTFRYGQGVPPPRVVHHEPRLPDGDCLIEVDLSTAHGRKSVTRTVRLSAGGSTSIDVAEMIPR